MTRGTRNDPESVRTLHRALDWVLACGNDVVPIPGTKRVAYLEENAAAADVALTEEDRRWIEALLQVHPPSGERYSEAMQRWVDRD
jgi:aryl-alcohol dehydrogenase-like predicted oxidoreductase